MRRCFVCSKRLLAGAHNVQNVLDRCPSIGAPPVTVLREILERPIPNEDLHSNDICKDCCKAAIKYDAAKKVLTHIKTDLLTKFKYGLQKFNLTYRTYPNKPVTFQKKVVVSSSKLQPLPADYVLNIAKIPGSLSPEKNNLPKNANVSSSQAVNIKSSTVASLTTQSKTTVSPQKTTATVKTTETIASTLSSILSSQSTTTTSNMLKFNVESLPKDFLSNAMLNKTAQKEKNDELHDEQPMEIDEDCTLVRVTQKEESENSSEENGQKSPKKSQYFDVSLLPLAEGSTNDTILGKLQILDQTEGEDVEDEAEEQETIVMTGDDGSIYRIVSGQKVVYADGEITLDDDDDDDGGSNQEDNDNDAHDSNDESQIELQVSGDEETANAIIAAAQEQGGAFIKVESGEMFRVKSVQSKTAGGQEDNQALHIVAVEDDVFKCLLCQNADKGDKSSKPFEVSDPARMTRHLKSEHDARVYICGICRRVMRRRQDYSKHIEEHTAKTRKFAADKKTYECPQCKKRFSTRTLLQLHINNHSGAKPYACSICHKAFASKYTHQAHLKTHLERSRPFQCQQCSKTFFTQQNLNQHEKTHLGIKDFVCNICGKAFGTQHNLEVHGVVHSGSKPFVCGVCGKAFARRAEVKDHMRIHTGERPFACEVCGATFTQRSNLHSHRRATHLDDKRHQCTQCPKRFKRRRLLDYHIKATHTGERPLVCGVCHATFVYPEHYKKHARIHSGDKPYVCEVCGKSFNSRDNRNTHRFVHSDKKPYECLVCGAGYMRKQLLYAHMNTSGHLAESIVVNQPRVQKVQEKIEPEPNTDSDHLEAIISQPNELQAIASKADEPVSSVEPAAKLFITGDKKIILQDGKINLLQDTMDPTLLSFIQNLDGSVKSDAGEHVQMVTSDENGAIRLVEVHIAANPWTINQG